MPRPALIVTGASGFVGRHLLDELKDDYRIFAIARRSQRDCGAPVHANIAWMQVDIGDREELGRTFREIASAGGAQLLLHLAAYYDFAGENRLEYRRTNVDGTHNVLDFARGLKLARFVFASSVAACGFPRPEGPITEATPPDGRHIYAWSKREGERLVREATPGLPTCIVRFGAVFSDWCEYPPLYLFLRTWLGGSWRARVLAGRGRSAVPYIHIRDVVSFFRHFLSRHERVEPGAVLVASTSGCTSHRRLFELATRSYLGVPKRPIFLPAPICGGGLLAMGALGLLTGKMPFERPWMVSYIDRAMEVDASSTYVRLAWTPSARYQMERRLPFLIERLKSEPVEWHARNAAAMRRDVFRPDLAVLKSLVTVEHLVVDAMVARVQLLGPLGHLPNYGRMDPDELVWLVRLVYRLLLTSVQTSNRMVLVNYLELTAGNRFRSGFTVDEVCLFLQCLNDTVLETLESRLDVRRFAQELHDRITFPIELGMDEVRSRHEQFLEGEALVPEQTVPQPEEGETSARHRLEETIWSCLVQRR
jgi:nucleoside-diphosphate-sugar epimerase